MGDYVAAATPILKQRRDELVQDNQALLQAMAVDLMEAGYEP
jgi:hypothetical protein